MNACPARALGGSSPVVAILRHSITVCRAARGGAERAGWADSASGEGRTREARERGEGGREGGRAGRRREGAFAWGAQIRNSSPSRGGARRTVFPAPFLPTISVSGFGNTIA
jgi:hypothetical protein